MNLLFSVVLFLSFLLYNPYHDLHAQNKSINISATADSLQNLLAVNSQNLVVKKSLIDAYLQNSEIELALLECLDISNSESYNDDLHYYRGKILLGVGNFKSALHDLKTSYFRFPTDEKLMNIAFSYFAIGNHILAKSLFDQLVRKNSNTDQEAIALHAILYKGNRNTVANLIPSFYKELYPEKYNIHFPMPLLTVLSPENNSTVYDESTIIFSVSHSRPISSVMVNDEELFTATNTENEGQSFLQNFSTKVNIPAGPSLVNIRITDIYQFSTEANLNLLGLGFKRDYNWRSSYFDSVVTNLSFLNSFIPQEVTRSSKSSNINIIAYSAAPKESQDFEKSVFWYDLFASEHIGLTDKKNIKPLMLEYANIENFKRLHDDWLNRSTNFQSKSILYFNSRIKATENTIEIQSQDGNYFDILPNLTSSLHIMSDGVIIIFDGKVDNLSNLQTVLGRLLSETLFPAGVVVMNEGSPTLPIISFLLKPESLASETHELTDFTLSNLESISSSIHTLKSPKGSPRIMENPAGKTIKIHKAILAQLETRLKSDRISSTQAEKIRLYSSDWKMYNDVDRFLKQEITLSDLNIKIDEYNTRMGGY